MLNNAIVIMFDSLRFDYVGCYGNNWIKTPNMDRLAREGVLFENSYTEGLPTIPCRRAMHTGRYTLPNTGWEPLYMDDTTIADLCWGKPIDSALIFDCPMYRQPKFGYTRGFDKVFFTHGHEMDHYFYENDKLFHLNPEDYMTDSVREGASKQYGETVVNSQIDEITSYLKQCQHWKSEDDRYVARTVSKAIEYLENVDRNKQFFLWIDSFDPHEPWNPPSLYMKFPCPYDPDYKGKDDFLPFMGDCDGVYDERTLQHIRALYAECITVCDTQLGKLMDAIHRLGFEENTLLMMVSDHGEPLGYGKDGHGIMRKVRPWPYEELSHTPLIIRGPGLPAGTRVKGFVQSVDVAPTVCDWLGIGVHPDMQGFSLLPLARGEVDKVRDFAISGYHKYSAAIYTEDWVFVHWTANERHTAGFNADAVRSVYANAQHLESFKFLNVTGSNDEPKFEEVNDAFARHKAAATIDGEEQWTCTPGAAATVPEMDELYDRHNDPYQLNNVITQHPDIAEDLLMTLNQFMRKIKRA